MSGPGSHPRVPAPQLEAFISQTLRRLEVREADHGTLHRIELHPQHVRILLQADGILKGPRKAALAALQAKLDGGETLALVDDATVEFSAPRRLSFVGGRTWITDADRKPLSVQGRTDPAVAKALKASHATLSELGVGPASSMDRLSEAKAVPHPHLRAIARLAFLAPDIQEAILEGRLTPHFNVGALTVETLPLAWADQRAMFGL